MKRLILRLDELEVESFATAQLVVEYDVAAFSPQTGCAHCAVVP